MKLLTSQAATSYLPANDMKVYKLKSIVCTTGWRFY